MAHQGRYRRRLTSDPFFRIWFNPKRVYGRKGREPGRKSRQRVILTLRKALASQFVRISLPNGCVVEPWTGRCEWTTGGDQLITFPAAR